MNVKLVTLTGPNVRLEPLALDHAEDLWHAASPDLFAYMWSWEHTGSPEEFRQVVQHTLDVPDWLSFAMVLTKTGQAVGSTSFLDIRPAHRGLEIGATWIGKVYQGTNINPENKYLLLRHCFETLGMLRVQLKTDGRNLHSQRAIAKLGAHLEGTLRKHIIMPDGYFRDSVMFSITEDEWPQVKAGLEERLGYIP
jgi:ribosomal-protein-alanine N-acetyltransferase